MHENNRKGLTLLECLVVIGILGVSICAVLQLATVALRSSARSQRIMRACVLAQNELEYWRNQGGAKLLSLGEGDHQFQNPFASAPENRVEETTLTVHKIEDGILEATAAASLPSEPERPASVRLTTYFPIGNAQ